MSLATFSKILRQTSRLNKNVPAIVTLRYYGTEDGRIAKMVSNNKVVVFMKGVPAEPRCGFSNAVVQILRMHGVDYDAHDVLIDEKLRQGSGHSFFQNKRYCLSELLSMLIIILFSSLSGIKDFSNWPTIPQVYINGEFVGGCDILLQMHQSGDLIDELKKAGISSALLDSAQKDAEGGSKPDSKS